MFVSRTLFPQVSLSSVLFAVFLKGFAFLDITADRAAKMSRIVDLDVDIGADAVDYKYAIF